MERVILYRELQAQFQALFGSWGLLITVFFLFCIFSSSLSAENDKPKPGVIGKRYRHVCPEGTERVGAGPPGTTLTFCRQQLGEESRLEGDYTAFYLNGNKRLQGEYSRGKRHGTWTQFYRTGEVQEVVEYYEGVPGERKSFKRDGVLVKSKEPKKERVSSQAEVQSELRKTRRGKKAGGVRGRELGWSGGSRNRSR
ncbi:MAG TPA: hypothetical protein PKA63_01775 [Oligoflexia bacterium]|nr:hypothetical protein [Oligoflexia bacterium]HMP47379.1 hypothetical protein [Oligoflexia bacterium]